MLATNSSVVAADDLHGYDARAHASSRPLLDVRGFFLFLRRRARLIVTTALLLMTCAVAILFFISPRYTAMTVLLADPRQQRVVTSEAVLPGIGSDAAAVESQVELIESRALAQRVIRELKLDDDPEFTAPSLVGSAVAFVRGALGVAVPEDDGTKLEKVVDRFEENLKVRRRGLTYVLEVAYTSLDAAKAARIANAIAEAYLGDQVAAKSEATSRASGWLNERLDELRSKVRDADHAVEAFKAQNNIVDVGSGQTLSERQVAELNQQLILARARTAEARARLDQVRQSSSRAGPTGSLPEALQSQVIASLRAQHAQLASTEAEMRSTYGPRHPALVNVQAQLAKISGQIDREVARVSSGLRNEYEAAKSREQSLEASLTALKQQSASISQATVRLRELEREAQANRAVFEQFLLRFKETSEQQSLQKADARIVSPAATPIRPSYPKKLLTLLISALGSCLAGIGLAAVADSFSQVFRTGRDVETLLSVRSLGLVPRVERSDLASRRHRGGWLRRTLFRSKEAGQRELQRALMRFGVDRPSSPFAEGLRAMRLRLRGNDGENATKVVLVTSALAGEGKSTVAINLAHAMAKNGVSTLLIDMDLRNSSISRVQAPRSAGVVDLLSDRAQLRTLLRKDADTGLHFLPAGQVQDAGTAAELMIGGRVKGLIDSCRERFDVIILDAPPLLPVVDSRRLLDHVDAAILVIEWSSTEPDSVHAALRGVGPNARKIIGAVLNKVDLRTYRYYDYAFGEGYGEVSQPLAAA
jgi:succinoglycan biosynthesis transport protein ExoP